MGRIPQFFGHAAVAAGLLASGASLLNAGGAMAAVPCSNLTGGDFTIGSPLTVSAGVDPLNCELINYPPANRNLATVDVDYSAIVGVANGQYEYTLSSTLFPDFKQLSMNVDIGGFQQGTVTKSVYSVATGGLVAQIQSVNGAPVTLQDFGIPTTGPIKVVDTWSIQAGTSMNSISNNFVATPGPLPILGAGAAFGFSRKLRGRIKAGRTA